MKDNGNKESFQVHLNEFAKAITAYGKDIQKSAEKIKQSIHIPDSKGAAHRNLLLNKTNNLNNLAALHNSIAKKMINSSIKLSKGVPVDEVASEVLAYMLFFSDQIRCEETGVRHFLSTLRAGRHDSL